MKLKSDTTVLEYCTIGTRLALDLHPERLSAEFRSGAGQDLLLKYSI